MVVLSTPGSSGLKRKSPLCGYPAGQIVACAASSQEPAAFLTRIASPFSPTSPSAPQLSYRVAAQPCCVLCPWMAWCSQAGITILPLALLCLYAPPTFVTSSSRHVKAYEWKVCCCLISVSEFSNLNRVCRSCKLGRSLQNRQSLRALDLPC